MSSYHGLQVRPTSSYRSPPRPWSGSAGEAAAGIRNHCVSSGRLPTRRPSVAVRGVQTLCRSPRWSLHWHRGPRVSGSPSDTTARRGVSGGGGHGFPLAARTRQFGTPHVRGGALPGFPSFWRAKRGAAVVIGKNARLRKHRANQGQRLLMA